MIIKKQLDTNTNKVITCKVGNKTTVWLPDINKYILVLPPADKIIDKIYQRKNKNDVIEYCIKKFGYSKDESILLYNTFQQKLKDLQAENKTQKETVNSSINGTSVTFKHKKYYSINQIIFFIEYETAEIKYLIHPKFAHLEIQEVSDYNHHFQLYKKELEIIFIIDGGFIGRWSLDREHFMTGKVSMEILQKIYHNNEEDWMAVFHAAGISNGKEGILFLGDSGNGKSTLSALLLATGYDVLADDFLPIESETKQLCSFPSAISVKKYAIELLSESFPELKNAKEYVYPEFNKTVKYLSNPNSANSKPKKVPCKALIFVKYAPESNLQFKPLSKDIAFQKLVPDSWISPLEENAKNFLSWFESLPCYELKYSDNKKMIETVQNIFNDKL